jgi:hypothetical protein
MQAQMQQQQAYGWFEKAAASMGTADGRSFVCIALQPRESLPPKRNNNPSSLSKLSFSRFRFKQLPHLFIRRSRGLCFTCRLDGLGRKIREAESSSSSVGVLNRIALTQYANSLADSRLLADTTVNPPVTSWNAPEDAQFPPPTGPAPPDPAMPRGWCVREDPLECLRYYVSGYN